MQCRLPTHPVAWLALGSALLSCSVYDPSLVSSRSVEARATQGEGSGLEGGDAAVSGDAATGDRGEGGGDVAVERCGDGKVSLSEKCDIAIPPGSPGACPTECPALADCVIRRLEGSNCQAECVALAQRCEDDDGCCPSICDFDNDDDCSATCGDGVVQPDEGELCEPGVQTADACPTQCADDGDPCTATELVGSPGNCNARCVHTAIATVTSGDGCCLQGANANIDSDCTPVCGNGVREPGEECDGSMGCNSACVLTLTPLQLDCIDRLAGEDPCMACSCTQCTRETLDCMASGDESRDMHCDVVTECSDEHGCLGDVCYCGTTRPPPSWDCYYNANGPCIAEIEAAAGTSSAASLLAQRSDPSTAIGLATLLGTCKIANCADACR